MNKSYGEIAYEAYCKSREWKSFNGDPLPQYQAQSKSLQDAWQQAGQAVADAISIITGRG